MGRSDAPAQSFAGGTPSVVVGALAVFAEVEPFALGFLGHPKAGKRLGDEDRDRGADSRPDDRREDGLDLDDKLRADAEVVRSEEHTSELQSLMRISYAVFCLKKKPTKHHN